MSKDLSAKYYQKIMKKNYKKLVEDIKVFQKKKKRKKQQYALLKEKKISQKTKNKNRLSIEKTILQNEKKGLIIITRNYSYLENLVVSLGMG